METNPKVFISYTRSDNKNDRIISISKQLLNDGVDTILDVWDLLPGDDKHVYMQRIVTDKTINKILIFCTKKYKYKAENREGGTGEEAGYISQALFDLSDDPLKFLPILFEEHEKYSDIVPCFLGSKIFLDFSKESIFEEEYKKLLDAIYEKKAKPPLGSPLLKFPPLKLFNIEKADITLIKEMRSDSEFTTPSVEWEKYEQHLVAACKKENFQIDTLLTSRTMKTINKEILEQNTLDLVVADDLSYIKYCLGDKILEVEEPQLLWNCCCNVPGAEPTQCPIHSQKYGSEITKAFQNGIVKIIFRKTSYLWKDARSLWPPAIDSFFFIKNIIDLCKGDNSIKKVADIGSGTGFLGLETALHIGSVKKLVLHDFTMLSYVFASINMQRNRFLFLGRNFSWENTIGYSMNAYQSSIFTYKKQFDLLICNPPYLPIPEKYMELREQRAVSGLVLLKHILLHGHENAKKIVVSFSSICEPEINAFIKTNKIILRPFGTPAYSPFRIPDIMKNTEFFTEVLKPRLSYASNSIYPYHHTIQSYLVENK